MKFYGIILILGLIFFIPKIKAQSDTTRIKELKAQSAKYQAHCDSIKRLNDSVQKQLAELLKKYPDPVKKWSRGGTVSLNATQVSLTNWVGGGQNSISIGSISNFFANYKNEKASWDNSLTLQYGIIKQQTNKYWWKNDDQLQLTSKYGQRAFDSWNYSMLLDFKTQFSPGFNYPNDSVMISDILAPGYGIVALGLDWKPDPTFALLLAPLTGKFTIVNNQRLADAGSFGVEKAEMDTAGRVIKHGKKFRSEMGGYVKLHFKKEVLKNMLFETNLEMFSNYLVNPQNIDVVWTTLTTFRINKLLSASLSTHLIYDDDVKVPVDRDKDGNNESNGPRVQLKQIFGLGFAYRL